MLSRELIVELKTILLDEFGFDLPDSDVVEAGNTLVDYFEVLAKINHE